ncbi:VanW family protein [Patescibacteria group bacterium]|nr:VanW family protein [Patescibacteria group bacterium]MBU1682448.1 VanW family protein [Patescibacteria group bacterium]MBU1934527.1 VanW family protein [Patescibacteria group bacterium]
MIPVIALVVFFCNSTLAAETPQSFGQEYGLLVHNSNQDEIVSRIKVLSVLLEFFPDAAPSIDINDDESICSLEFLDCYNHFYGYRNVTQKEFLMWFHYLSSMHNCLYLDGDPTYNDLWLDARNNNWLTGNQVTYGVFEDFLYRYKVSDEFLGHPYYDELVLNTDEINPYNFSDLRALPEHQSNIFEHILELKSQTKLSDEEDEALERLNEYYDHFKGLEDEIREMLHPFNQISNLPDDIKAKIVEHNLNEILGQVNYNYSTNIENRKHNLVTGVSKMNGKVWMPGDVIDFMEVLGDDGGWWDYKWGWVIFGGREEWQYGGGLCGSATIIFTPSWQAGLEIITRYPHSSYYRSLYPEQSLGLDATIYRGSHKNLQIQNNTESPIIYYVENNAENEVVTVYIIGNSPYKSIEIEGPIQTASTTYKWIRSMEKEDGTVNTEELVTHYWAVY